MKKYLYLLLLSLSISAQAITPWESRSFTQAVAQKGWELSESLLREFQTQTLTAPQSQAVNYNLALSLYHQGKFEEALPYFEAVGKSKTKNALVAEAHYNMGNTLFRLEKLKEAKEAFQQALLANPDDDDARYNIEVILDKEKENEKNNEDKQQNQDQKNQDQKNNEDQDKNEQDPSDKEQNDSKDEKEQDPNKPKEGDPENGEQKESEEQKPGETEKQMSEAEKQEAKEKAEREQLLDYFSQQEKKGRPTRRAPVQAPPVRGKTW